MRRMIYAIALLMIVSASTACNTVRGMGRDVERAGEKTQDASENVRRRL
jgi:entericidin B